MSEDALQIAREAKQQVETHIQIYERDRKEFNEQYQRDRAELNQKIGGIFRRIDSMSNRWLMLSGALIMILLSVSGWLTIALFQAKGLIQ